MIDLALEPDFELGAAFVRPSLHEIIIDGQGVVLEPRVMQVLVLLGRRRGEIVSRDDLIESCWEQRIVSDDSINRAISRLRVLQGASGAYRIETIPRVGYRLFEILSEGAATGTGTTPDRWSRLLGKGPARRAAALALLAMAGAGSTYAYSASQSRQAMALAVLPFNDLSVDQSCSYFSRAVAEEIAVTLADNSDIRVVGGLELEKKASNSASYRTLQSRFAVTHVLEGSVRIYGETIRVTTRLLDAGDGTQLWARHYTGDIDDIAGTQQLVSNAVAIQLSGRRTKAFALDRTDGETYRKFLTARGMLASGEPGRHQRARELLAEVVERDPNYRPGRLWLAVAGQRADVGSTAMPQPYTVTLTGAAGNSSEL